MPMTLKQANDFVTANHRHLGAVRGHKFSIALLEDHKIVGCVIVGRPLSRHLDNGLNCEITRLCTNGARNGCSKLYSAAAKTAKYMGYKNIYTYIQINESGTSLKASGWCLDKAKCGGGSWSRNSRKRNDSHNTCFKKRYVLHLN